MKPAKAVFVELITEEPSEIIDVEIITSVTSGEEAIGYCLKAVDRLTKSIGNGNPKEAALLQGLLKVIEQFEKK